ncbi:hypothetical protein L1987_45555 [Smallanthus sonchifolius]|uniref:Uncharacterized protein n=1 Tax=Smallanthus sonchifolius TaxID=185202 RepID=A0ACB9FYA3_9ASTR|nr:hypothetical protein L1987_45555 [Smallanthus sonchifolius]
MPRILWKLQMDTQLCGTVPNSSQIKGIDMLRIQHKPWAHLTSKIRQPQIQSSTPMESSSSDESVDPADALTDDSNSIHSISTLY